MKRLILFILVGITLLAGLATTAFFYLFPHLPIEKTDTLAIAEVIAPRDEPTGLVYLLSDKDGYGLWDRVAARRFAASGAIVVGIDTPKTLAKVRHATDDCVYFISDFEQVSQDVQRVLEVDSYHSPVIAGAGLGGTFALALAAQTPEATIGRTIAVNPQAVLPLKRELCSDGHHVKASQGTGWIYDLQAGPLPDPIDVYTTRHPDQSGVDHVADMVAHGYAIATAASARNAFNTLNGAVLGQLAVIDTSGNPLADIPITQLPAKPAHDTLAIILSGDGGWRDIDAEIGGYLANAGVPVVGIDSLRYFWNEKDPADAADDLSKVIDTYARKWNVKKVALVGYSFGADALPAIYKALPADKQAMVNLVSLIAYSGAEQFEIQVSGILGSKTDPNGPSSIPALLTIDPAKVQCIYGLEDDESACTRLPKDRGFTLLSHPGGHHFNDDYHPVANDILDRLAGTAAASVATPQPAAPAAPQPAVSVTPPTAAP